MRNPKCARSTKNPNCSNLAQITEYPPGLLPSTARIPSTTLVLSSSSTYVPASPSINTSVPCLAPLTPSQLPSYPVTPGCEKLASTPSKITEYPPGLLSQGKAPEYLQIPSLNAPTQSPKPTTLSSIMLPPPINPELLKPYESTPVRISATHIPVLPPTLLTKDTETTPSTYVPITTPSTPSQLILPPPLPPTSVEKSNTPSVERSSTPSVKGKEPAVTTPSKPVIPKRGGTPRQVTFNTTTQPTMPDRPVKMIYDIHTTHRSKKGSRTPNQRSGYVFPIDHAQVPVVQAPKTDSYGIVRSVEKQGPQIPKDIFDNPWYHKPAYSSNIKIAAVTLFGNIAPVPTSVVMPETPRKRMMRSEHITLDIIEEPNPIAHTAMYFNQNRDDNVSEHMKSITQGIQAVREHNSIILKALPNVKGIVTCDIFEEMLRIYENNQVYYQDRIEDHTIDIDTIKYGLTQLEHWFMNIIEPCPNNDNIYLDQDIEDWKSRELFKKCNGMTSYCDNELHKYIKPMLIVV